MECPICGAVLDKKTDKNGSDYYSCHFCGWDERVDSWYDTDEDE